MNGKFDQQEFDKLKKDFEELKAAFYKNNFISEQVFTKKITFKNDVSFSSGNISFDGDDISFGAAESLIGLYGVDATGQHSAIANPSGGTTVDSQARGAIDNILASLRSIGIIKSS